MKPAHLMILVIASCSLVVASGQPQRASAGEVALTVLYDNASGHGSVIADHGFSCPVEAGGRSLLFDAGRRAETFMANARRLGVDLPGISHVVISHFHGDHTGGLFDALARGNKPQLLLPFSSPPHTGRTAGRRGGERFPGRLYRDPGGDEVGDGERRDPKRTSATKVNDGGETNGAKHEKGSPSLSCRPAVLRSF